MAKKKDKNRHSFWKKLHFKYRLSILNENTLDEVWKLRVSMFNGIMLYAASFFILMIIASVIIISTPIRNYLPGYLDSEIREQAIKAAIRVDSLETSQKHQEAYIQNILDIFEGKVDTIPVRNGDNIVKIAADDKSLQSSNKEKKFRNKYEEDEKYNIASLSPIDSYPTEGVTFFRPVKGVIAERFNANSRNYGVQINIAGETVVATLEGSIMYAGYNPEQGYFVQIQHKNGFTSIYKGVSIILKKTGDKVRTGEAIALIDNRDDTNKKKILQFELWYKGNPVNPELYILF